MKLLLLFLISLSLIAINCNTPIDNSEKSLKPNKNNQFENTANSSLDTEIQTNLKTESKLSEQELLSNIQEAIIPSYKDWVIMKNGTYIIFDNIDTVTNISKSAIQLLRKYKPKTAAEHNWDYSITDLDKTEGWSVFGNGYGIYNYVHPKELTENPSAEQIAAFAKVKRTLDENNPKIIYINSKNGLIRVK
ncbi:MAG: hypothetical protein MK207_09735 [Saprospiraceae bacterium]|nr:hypothetical protein [Saprospiraceae bacterium]